MITNKKINSAVKRKFLRPLNDGTKYNVSKLKIDRKVKYKETISLLTQSYDTLNNVEKLIKSNDLIDANSLLRAAFEYILVGMMIQFEDKVYDEFINLSIDDDNARDYTKIQKLINRFKTHLNEINSELFDDLNRSKKGKMFTDLYDKLCKFTHGSLFVSTIVEIKNNNEKEVLKLLNYQNYYFIKILLFHCLKYFTNDNTHYISIESIAFSFMFNYLKIYMKTGGNISYFEKYNDYLHVDENLKYFNKDDKYKEKLKKDMIELKPEIDNDKFENALIEFLK